MLWRNSIWIIPIILCSCSSNSSLEEHSIEKTVKIDSTELMLCISIPKSSGLAFVDFRDYVIEDEHLYVIDRFARFDKNQTNQTDYWVSDTLEFHTLESQKVEALKRMIQDTDSIGDQIANGCPIQMGWPRFYISTSYNGRVIGGFLSNCYREHVFQFVDFMNDCYPKGDILSYRKEELIQTEKDCNEFNGAIEQKKTRTVR